MNTHAATSLPPLLLPRPARLSFIPSPTCTHIHRSSLPAVALDPALPHLDAYRLIISPHSPFLRITHRSSIGLAYAHATLAQLRNQYGDCLPTLEILDYPAIQTRGVMLDVSRGRIPTMPEFARLIPTFASLKLNHIQLYTEHSFAYTGHEDVWQDWNPITPAELATLQSWCVEHHIELAANQNCFGHLAHWLKHPRYAPLAETHGQWRFDRFTRSGPFSLCPGDPGSLQLLRDLLGQLLPLFDSHLVNVGCDETHDLGQGRSCEAVGRRGKATVYFDFLDQVFDLVRAHGKRPLFWADIARHHPDSIARIADDATALVWGYEANSDFDHICGLLSDEGKKAWVCPGTSSWRSITGRTTTRKTNLSEAADTATRYALGGYLVTDWGDAGHQQVWPIALTAIAEAADRAWNAGRVPVGSPSHPDSRAISLHCFQDPSLSVADWLDALGDIDLELRLRAGRDWFEGKGHPLENASVHFADLAEAWGSEAIALDADDFQLPLERVASLRATIPPLPGLLGNELSHTLDRAEFALLRARARRQPSAHTAGCRDLLDKSLHVLETHHRLWLGRSRPGLGLEASIDHDQRLVEELRHRCTLR